MKALITDGKLSGKIVPLYENAEQRELIHSIPLREMFARDGKSGAYKMTEADAHFIRESVAGVSGETKPLREMAETKLNPDVTRRGKSFYGKAHVDDGEGKDEPTITLRSYDTDVAEVKGDLLYVHGWFSMTTCRHINEFAAQNGFRTFSKSDINGGETIWNKDGEKVHESDEDKSTREKKYPSRSGIYSTRESASMPSGAKTLREAHSEHDFDEANTIIDNIAARARLKVLNLLNSGGFDSKSDAVSELVAVAVEEATDSYCKKGKTYRNLKHF